MMEGLADTIRSTQLAIERARLIVAMARRTVQLAHHERLRATGLCAEAQRLRAGARYNKPR